MRRLESSEPVSLHDALEAFPNTAGVSPETPCPGERGSSRCSGHIDQLTGDEMRCRDLRAYRQDSIARYPKLLQLIFRRNASFGEMAEHLASDVLFGAIRCTQLQRVEMGCRRR